MVLSIFVVPSFSVADLNSPVASFVYSAYGVVPANAVKVFDFPAVTSADDAGCIVPVGTRATDGSHCVRQPTSGEVKVPRHCGGVFTKSGASARSCVAKDSPVSSRRTPRGVMYARTDGKLASSPSRYQARRDVVIGGDHGFSLNKQFHDRTRTKAMIINHHDGDRIVTDRSHLNLKTGKLLTGVSMNGGAYNLRSTPFVRRRNHHGEPKGFNKIPRKSVNIYTQPITEVNTLSVDTLCSLFEPIPPRRETVSIQFGSFDPLIIPLGRETPPMETKFEAVKEPEKPIKVEARRISPPGFPAVVQPSTRVRGEPMTLPKSKIRDLFSLYSGEPLAIAGKVGLHHQHRSGFKVFKDTVSEYLAFYSPYSDDFFTSHDCDGVFYNVYPCGARQVVIKRLSDQKCVARLPCTREYTLMYEMHHRKNFNGPMARRYSAPAGLCYLNHIWFLCLIAGHSFNPARAYFSRGLGRFPRFSNFLGLVERYFSYPATRVSIKGYFSRENLFHCDNFKGRLHSLSYNRINRANIGGDAADSSDNIANVVTPLEKEKLISQLIETARGHKDSLLLKKLEVDLVDHITRLKASQSKKPERRVPYHLTEQQQTLLVRDYPQYDLLFTHSSHSDHPMAAASRFLENNCLADKCGDNFSDVGGCPLYHYHNSKMKRVHVCRPVLDSKDAQRRVIRNFELKKGSKSNNQVPEDNVYVNSMHTSCSLTISECTFETPSMMLVQVYDIPLRELCEAMIKKSVNVCHVTMVTPGEILDKRECFHHDLLGCDITIDIHEDSITYKFGSSCYTHDLSVILGYMTTPVVVVDNYLFSVEMVEIRCGVNYYVITRSDVCPSMDCGKTVRFQRCCMDLVKVKLPRFCKKSRKCLPGVDLIYVDRKFVERVYEYVVGNCSVINSKTFEWTWNFVKNSKSRVVISGKIIHRDVSINLDNLEQFVVVMLAAGVRSRIASEYLAKNISMFAGDASFMEIVCFTLNEKLKDVKRQFNKFVCDSFRKMFADALLMEFLDIDDSLEYLDSFSEYSVRIRVAGFGAIPVNEPEIMLAEKSLNDTVDALVVEQANKIYCPPHARQSKREKPKSGGLNGGARRSPLDVYEGIRTALSKVCIVGSEVFKTKFFELLDLAFLGDNFSTLRRVLKFIKSLPDRLNVKDALDLANEAIVYFTIKRNKTACFFYKLYSSFSTKVDGCTREFLTSCADLSKRLVELGGSFKPRFTPLSECFSVMKNWSFFDGQQAIPFETCAIVLKRMIYDLKRLTSGEISRSQFFNRVLFDILFEHSLNALIACKIGVADTLLKDMFIRTVSTLVADGVLDGYDLTLFSFVKLTALIPMFVRKLIVAFFDDECCEYVAIVKHGVRDFSAAEYLYRIFVNNLQGHVLHCKEWLQSVLPTLQSRSGECVEAAVQRLEGYMTLKLKQVAEASASEMNNLICNNRIVKCASNSYGAVTGGLTKMYKAARKRCDYDDEASDYYSADGGSEAETSGKLRGGARKEILSSFLAWISKVIRSLYRYSIKEVKYFVDTQILSHTVQSMIDSLRCIREEFQKRRSLNSMPVIGSVENFGRLLRAKCIRYTPSLLSTYEDSGFFGIVRICTKRVLRDIDSFEFLILELPLYCFELYTHFDHPVTLGIKILWRMVEFTYVDFFACELSSLDQAPAEVFARVEEIENDQSQTNDEIEEESESDSDEESLRGLSYSESRERIIEGLRGGASSNNLLSFLIRSCFKVVKGVLTTKTFKLGFLFSLSSILSSVLHNRDSSVTSRCLATLLVLRDLRLSTVALLRCWSKSRLASNSQVSDKFFKCVLYVERRFTHLLYGDVETRVNQQLFRRVAVSSRVPTGINQGEIVASYKNISELRSSLENVLDNSIGKITEEYDEVDTEEAGASAKVRVEQCDEPLQAQEAERADLTPYVSERLENDKECSEKSIATTSNYKRGRNSAKCCKFLNLQNISATIPSMRAESLGEFPKCTLAIREFYYAQEMVIFSVHSKLLTFFEELSVVDFDRRAATCHQEVDLLVFDPAKGTCINHEGRSQKIETVADHQFFFTRDGLKPYNSKIKLDRHALFHSQTKFLAANEFLLGCESHSTLKFRNTDVEIKLFEAPPGGGKTTSLIELYMERRERTKTFVVTANKNSQVEITNRISNELDEDSPPFDKKDIMTMDSYLMNRCGESCELLFIDECFMVHAGEVLAIINKTMCKVAILFGDSKQIHYIERDELVKTTYHDIDSFIEPFCRVYGEVSYRCPWDVCEWLSRLYNRKIKSHNQESVGRTTVKVETVESVDDIPHFEDVKYLTYTQSEKSDVHRKFSREKKVVNVNTVHEAQGETFRRVALVRTKFQEDAPFVSVNHIIVALSRHVESLTYYVLSSRVYDDTSSAINTMLDIAEKYRTAPRSFESSIIEMNVSGDHPDESRCKALSAPQDSINSFLNDVLGGSNTLNFGDLSAEMSSQPFDSGVDGVVIREAGNEKIYDDHANQRV
ncbi:1a [Tobacco virus 1]|uniref:1a n=1 Tax=Tobacco virus 1 TaxID=1692045 RepID=A0A0K1HRG5_9CLOS|nr:1a [Tobacco virus 1]AKT94757.1 1a [Tobacco virus 1]